MKTQFPALGSIMTAVWQSRQKIGSVALVSVMFLSVLALPNFSATSPNSNTDEYEMMLQSPVLMTPPEPEDDLVPGTGDLPNFMYGFETEGDQATHPNAEETEPEETEADGEE